MTEEDQNPQKELSYLDRVKEEREKMEKILEENKKILDRIEQIKAEQILSGKADAGQTQQKPKEESYVEYKNRIMRGEI